jgi:TatD DNase family protein
MTISIIDTHAHLDMAPFDEDRTGVIARARDTGVSTIINVGINLESSQKAVVMADNHSEVLAAVGFHPQEAPRMKKEDVTNLAKLANHPRVVAIGEIGLDFYRSSSPQKTQLQVLQWQLELAESLDLPVIIHCRQAEKEMLTLLQNWTSSHKRPNSQSRGLIHCFSGDTETAQRYLDMGFLISFGAYIGYPSSFHLRNVIKSIPQDKLVVETDSPFLPPQSHRGKRNEPSYLPLTVEALAEIREISSETAAKETTQNARRLFRCPEPDQKGHNNYLSLY